MSERHAAPARRLRPGWAFRRVALVLSGGGALGAYETGVLRALEVLGLKPAIIAGVSVGATNAVVWLAHDFRTATLEQTWRTLRPSSIGMRGGPLVLRALGLFLAALAALELVLTLAGSPELNLRAHFRNLEGAAGFQSTSTVLEGLAWVLVGLGGYLLAAKSRPLEDWFSRLAPTTDPERGQHGLGIVLLVGLVLYVVAVISGIPWALRFHAWVLAVGTVVWLANRPGRLRGRLRDLFLTLMPETRGRGLWGSEGRRRLLEDLVALGDPSRLVAGDVHLILSACCADDGRMSYFVNWPQPSAQFRERIHRALGDVVVVLKPRDVVHAAVASGAVPVLFEPVRFRGRHYLDGGVFSNQPLHAVVADGADAILLVLVSPSAGPRRPSRQANLVEIGARLTELSNWRDLQTELDHLPRGWSREGDPARVCVVEPPHPLPGSMFSFDPAAAVDLMRRGERDAWDALERAGWIEPAARA